MLSWFMQVVYGLTWDVSPSFFMNFFLPNLFSNFLANEIFDLETILPERSLEIDFFFKIRAFCCWCLVRTPSDSTFLILA